MAVDRLEATDTSTSLRSSLRFDAATLLLFATVGVALPAFFALVLTHQVGPLIPINDVYFGGDPKRVLDNLRGSSADFHRTPFHPLFPLFCLFFQHLQTVTSVSISWLLLLGSWFYGAVVGALTFLSVRVWGGTNAAATAAVVLLCSSASFIDWSCVPETHVWGGIAVTASLLASRWLPQQLAPRILGAAVLFVLASSVVVTDAMAWAPLAARRVLSSEPPGAPWTSRLRIDATEFVVSLLAGLGVLLLAFTVQRYLLHNNPTLGQLLDFSHDKKYMLTRSGSVLGGLQAIGLVAPTSGPSMLLGYGLDLLLVLAILWNGRKLPEGLVLASLLPIAVLMLHTLYDRAEAFICAPNYTPFLVVLFVLGLPASAGGRAFILVGGGALLLGALNLLAHLHAIDALTAAQRFAV